MKKASEIFEVANQVISDCSTDTAVAANYAVCKVEDDGELLPVELTATLGAALVTFNDLMKHSPRDSLTLLQAPDAMRIFVRGLR